MQAKRVFGVALVAIAIAAALALDAMGRDQQPRSYVVDFQRGTQLSAAGERRIERIAAAMQRQPAYSAVVVGHTGTRGAPEANRSLGRDRARTVAQALGARGVSPDRVEIFSAGGEEPLDRREDEGERGYQTRLSRAEVRLNP
jgi:Outer membrane protein and related peptidoglycan-associated (lipo)proteins